jgi:hypothetical protein
MKKKFNPRIKARLRKNRQVISLEQDMEEKFLELNTKEKFMLLCVLLTQMKFQKVLKS